MPALEIKEGLPADTQLLARLVRERHSCRGFRPERVPRDTIEAMLVIAQGAASWCNSQPWGVIVTEGEATERFRAALYGHVARSGWGEPGGRAEAPDFAFPARYAGIYKERQRATGWALYESVGIAHGDRQGSARQMLENFNLFGAPHVMIVTTEADLGVYGAIDCGGYVTSFMLAAQALGVATIPQAALAFHSELVRRHFGLGDDRRVVCGISFGYPDHDHKANSYRTTRASIADTATFVDE